jgi:hypothetical protein
MLRKSALVVSVALLTVLFTARNSSATSITVGTATSGNCYPFMCNDSGSASGQSIQYQQVYDAAALAALNSIGSITFFQDFALIFGGSTNLDPGVFAVSLSTTSAAVNGLSTNLASNIGADNALFFSGPLSGPASPSFTIFGTPFVYSSVNGNLLLNILVTNQANIPNGFGNGYNDADVSGLQTSRAYQVDGQTPGVDRTGLVTRFDSPNAAAPVPEPASLVLLGSGVAAVLARRRRRRRD